MKQGLKSKNIVVKKKKWFLRLKNLGKLNIIRFFSFLEGLNEDGQLLFGSKEKSTKTDAACLISLLFYGLRVENWL